MFSDKFCMKYVAVMTTPREGQDQLWRGILTAALAELEDSEQHPWCLEPVMGIPRELKGNYRRTTIPLQNHDHRE